MIYTEQQLKDLILPILQSMDGNYDGVASAIVQIILEQREAYHAEIR